MRRTGKFSDRYEGPYIISKQLGDVNYVLNKPEQHINMVVHINRLKPFKQPERIKKWIIYPEQNIILKTKNTETTTPLKITQINNKKYPKSILKKTTKTPDLDENFYLDRLFTETAINPRKLRRANPANNNQYDLRRNIRKPAR